MRSRSRTGTRATRRRRRKRPDPTGRLTGPSLSEREEAALGHGDFESRERTAPHEPPGHRPAPAPSHPRPAHRRPDDRERRRTPHRSPRRHGCGGRVDVAASLRSRAVRGDPRGPRRAARRRTPPRASPCSPPAPGCAPTETRRSEVQIRLQQFSTPLPYAYVAAVAAAIRPGDVALEPSAGTGALAHMAARAGAKLVLNEIDPFRAMLLEATFDAPLSRHDGEHIDDLLDRRHITDVVVMNPPFSSSASRAADPTIALRHAVSAAKRLAPGGRLVAILPMAACADRQPALWRRLAGRRHPAPASRPARHRLPQDGDERGDRAAGGRRTRGGRRG